MRRLILLLTLLVGLTACAQNPKTVEVPRSPIETAADSVNSLHLYPEGNIFCTAFSINEKQGYWMTARHCTKYIKGMDTWDATIGDANANHWAQIVYQDANQDIAVVQSPVHARALALASEGPSLTDPVTGMPTVLYVIGYPWGALDGKTVTTGHIGKLLIPIFNYYPSTVLDLTVAPGNSGSPVLNARGEIVGLLWGRYTESNHALGVPYDQVRRVYEMFATRPSRQVR